MVRAILLWSLYERNFSLYFTISSQTIKPMPPESISRQAVMFTTGSLLNSHSEEYAPYLPLRSKPALQNAEIARKAELPMPCRSPILGMNRVDRSNAPMPSQMNVPVAIFFTMRIIPPSSGLFTLSLSTLRSFRPIFLPVASAASEIMVINPIPPIWIRIISTICPKIVHWLKVS